MTTNVRPSRPPTSPSNAVMPVAPPNGNDEGPTAVAAVAPQESKQNESPDCEACTAAEQAAGKFLATLRSQLALKGYSLSRSHGDDGPVCFYVSRWDLVRELRDIAAVRAFAEQVGASNA